MIHLKTFNEMIKVPIKVGDTVLGGRFKNKKTVVKKIGKNDKGDITINGKPLLKYRIVKESASYDDLKNKLEHAAIEEEDHLAWCERRLEELDSRPSLLNPVWYAGSFVLGSIAGLAGDKISLGFVAETEKQVEHHLDDHLKELPSNDHRSRAIVAQMRADEIAHGQMAIQEGGVELPSAVQEVMKTMAKVMTVTAYRI